MSNTYFQFKQFTIHQEYCAMKVTTDACLFGAWVAELISSYSIDKSKALDIGTGTGLLSLMIAQKSIFSQIDAVEIDESAANQAITNFADSIYSNQLFLYQSDIKHFNPTNKKDYNFIFTNPPFFNDDLKSVSTKRNLAMHSEALSLPDLLTNVKRLLNIAGDFAILLPHHRSDYFEQLACEAGFHTLEKVLVKQTPTHPPFRTMLLFGYQKEDLKLSELIIKADNQYTEPFTTLLKDYYLKL